MVLKQTHYAATASFFSTLLLLKLLPTVVSVVPNNKTSPLDAWIQSNMKHYSATKSFGQTLKTTDDEGSGGNKVIKVRKDGSGDFKTVTEAVESVPSGNSQRVIISIGPGTYTEKIQVEKSKPYITFYGESGNMPTLSFAGTAKKYGTYYSATVTVESDNFMAVNIAFENSAPAPDPRQNDQQAVAMRIAGDKAAFYNCKFIGYQDTLFDDQGKHLFKNCLIQGTVDFIFGNGKSVYTGTTINSVAKGLGTITAQGREDASDDSGFVFLHCKIQGTGDTYLGRAWRKMPRVVFAYTEMGSLIDKEGWSDNASGQSSDEMYYGEYKCTGPGASSSGRAKFAKILSDDEAAPFLSTSFIDGSEWIQGPPSL
ncbi:putative pectinesterase 63 [Corylus avellana]|uniref:putative pectinesterase 63 n=1 Tax=Corylus avellana TaxID=13451 RepID=UPI00286AF922|nr:putative pectinesterase 63 [Corylus avellana]